jgi:hypothetical protein
MPCHVLEGPVSVYDVCPEAVYDPTAPKSKFTTTASQRCGPKFRDLTQADLQCLGAKRYRMQISADDLQAFALALHDRVSSG